MRHLIVPATWKSAGALKKLIEEKERDGWSVSALGEVGGGNVLIMVDDGRVYQHDIIQVFWSLRGKIAEIIGRKQKEGWMVATVGSCLGSSLMILKREVGSGGEDVEFLMNDVRKDEKD